jgi:SPP1 gp7 family putative phage head morphogenesis protein
VAKRHLKGVARVIARQSAGDAAMLADSKTAYVRGQLAPIRQSLRDATNRFAKRTGKTADDEFKRGDRPSLLREIRRGGETRPGARIPEVPRFVGEAERMTSAALRRQVRDSAERVYASATAQAESMGLDLTIDKRAVLARTKRIMDKRIARYSRRTSDEMWLDIKRQTWRHTGQPVGKLEDILADRVKVYENRVRRIIVTETNRAYNAQMVEVMDQLQEQNRDKKIMKRWDATIDKRLCADCREMHGDVVELHAKFRRWGIETPPLHPFCCCILTMWSAKRTQEND